MKNIKILAIAFVIGTSSLFATAVQFPPHNNTKHPVSKTDFDTKKNNKVKKVTANTEDTSVNVVYVTTNNNKLYNLNYNNKELLFKEMQLEAIKNYEYVMPDIIGKE